MIMTRDHYLFDEFCAELRLRLEKHKCDSTTDKPNTKIVLKKMGLTDDEIEQSYSYFESKGGYCDCEILMNVR